MWLLLVPVFILVLAMIITGQEKVEEAALFQVQCELCTKDIRQIAIEYYMDRKALSIGACSRNPQMSLPFRENETIDFSYEDGVFLKIRILP